MPLPEYYTRVKSPANSAVTLFKQLFKLDASNNETLALQEDITSITYTVTVDGVEGSSTALTVSSVVSNTAITGTAWTAEGGSATQTGCNFKVTIPGTALPTDGKSYLFKFTVTPAGGSAYIFGFIVDTANVG